MALSMCVKTSINTAGHELNKRTYASTQMTYIKFHIDFKEAAMIKVKSIQTKTDASTAFSADYFTTERALLTSSLGSYFGIAIEIVVPGQIDWPF